MNQHQNCYFNPSSLTNPSTISIFFFFFLLVSRLTSLVTAVDSKFTACSVPRSCGDGQEISYPFYIHDQDSLCGYPGFQISCNDKGNPVLQLPNNNDHIIKKIFYDNQTLLVSNHALFNDVNTSCISTHQVKNLSLPVEFILAPNHKQLYLLYNCSTSLPPDLLPYKVVNCEEEDEPVLAIFEGDHVNMGSAWEQCKAAVVAPVDSMYGDHYKEEMITKGFLLNWVSPNCSVCHQSGGKCGFDEETHHFKCFCPDRPHAYHCVPGNANLRLKQRLGLGFGVGGLIILIAVLSIYIVRLRKKRKYASTNLHSGNNSSNLSSRSDLEATGSGYFGVPVFSYSELEEATSKFNHDKELGDGGFGTVYYGKLKDGREVAVKRLYEHNYRRVEQFMNEIEILTRLRHKNLVSLYGCTSRHSQGLLLVYEYISNGTVADHLHGVRAKPGVVTWPIRMNIAIETASALAYLHACDTIHRDVKTNNILLDNNFCVKVADFGLSRLFPTDVTHVSTAPQGTPGYVDPEYHQCYQLTDKSDVYSFGVVLIELISSMPAVDITRHRHEINLSNLAMNRIQNCAIDELVDPYLGFQSDEEVERMVTSVAELAFQCLQQNKDMRPTMDEVLEELKKIKSGESKLKESKEGHDDGDDGELKSMQPPRSPPDYDGVALLKNIRLPSSPISVTAKWVSNDSTTPNVSA